MKLTKQQFLDRIAAKRPDRIKVILGAAKVNADLEAWFLAQALSGRHGV